MRRSPTPAPRLSDLEAHLDDALQNMGIAGPDRLEIALLHEHTLSLLAQGKYRQMRETADALLQRQPDFPPALNNIAQSYYAQGNLDQAMAAALRVLANHPDNHNALANLVHYHCLLGEIDQARVFAARLRSVQSNAEDLPARQAEAASYLGDDQAVLDAFHAAERRGRLKPPLGDPLLCHLAAVAAFRLGDQAQARR